MAAGDVRASKTAVETGVDAPTSLGAQWEHRYSPKRTHGNWLGYGLGLGGAALLGAAWMAPTGGVTLALLGGVAFPAGWWLWHPHGTVLRIGPAGIGFERRGDVTRLRWCDIDKVRATLSYLELRTAGGVHYVSLDSQPMAAARIVAECAQRIMTRVELSRTVHDRLPKLEADDSPSVAPLGIQIAGTPCADSGVPITLERDARLCPRCTAVYHLEHVPEACKVCGAAVRGRAWVA